MHSLAGGFKPEVVQGSTVLYSLFYCLNLL